MKVYKDLRIYVKRYVHSKSIIMLSLDYHESMGKIEEHEGNKYLMVNDYINLKNIVILIKCVIEADAKFYPQIFSE